MKQLVYIFTVFFTFNLNCGQAQDSLILQRGMQLVQDYEDEKAEPVLREALKEGNDLNPDQRGQGHLYLMYILWDRNEFSEAIQNGNEAIENFSKANNGFMVGKTLYSLCMKNLVAGDYELALKQIQESYIIFENLGDSSMMVMSRARKGLIFHDIAEYEEGLKECEQALEIYGSMSMSDADLKARVLGVMAINYDDNEQSERAVEIYQQVLELEPDLSNNSEIVRTYNNLGNSLRKLGRFEEAREYIQQNLQANQERNFPYGIATAKTNLGDIALKQGHFTEAKAFLSDAESIAVEINDVEKILDVLEVQHRFYETTGQLKESLDYLRRYHALQDSLYGLDKQRQLRLLEARFETEKKEQQIAVQQAEIAEQEAELETNQVRLIAAIIVLGLVFGIALLNRARIKKQQELLLQEEKLRGKQAEVAAAISSQENERSRYARDLHDGMGQMISVLTRNVQQLGDQGDNDVIERSEVVLRDMYAELKRICFDMKPQALTSGGLKSALSELADRINQLGNLKVFTDFSGFEQKIPERVEISLFRICQEWMNNILKYSDAKRIDLQITTDITELTLMIEDDGSGFDPNALESSKGNGWRNIHSRVDILGGSIHLETSPGRKGSSLIVDLPNLSTYN